MNCNNIMKAYRKYKYEMSNKRDDKKVANLTKWIFLDSQSTVDIFCNAGFLNNIQKTDYPTILDTNIGS